SQSTAHFNEGLASSAGLKIVLGIVLAALTGFIIYGGVRSISAITQILVPVMAVMYVGLGLLVVILNINLVPSVFLQIILGAFVCKDCVTVGVMCVILPGVRRGLFSNEAGMGSAPNAGATAAVSHPAKQGFVQSRGVYFDTFLVCSITAFIVLLSQPSFGD